MKVFLAATFLAILAVSNSGILPDFSHNWTNLRVTWSLNPLNTWGFDGLPRKVSEANSDWELKDDQCQAGGKFLGQRYWYKKDPAVVLLFDKNGIIAGIQTLSLKSKFANPPKNLIGKNYQDDGDYWALTAYFVDPQTICTTGRTEDELKQQGTGTGLWIQVGPNPLTDVTNIPRDEAAIKQTKWGFGKCFRTMGQHYWYDVSEDTSCDSFFPNCLLYNGGKLTGFCFTENVDLTKDSKRFDSPAPTPKVINKFLDPVPKCFYSEPSYQVISSIHVYFIDSPRVASQC